MSGNGPTREEIVKEALSWRGTPYVHQASTKGAGTDCLGLARGVYRTFYGQEPCDVPPYTADWTERMSDEMLLNAAQKYLHDRSNEPPIEAQVLLFRIDPAGPVKHMGIMTKEDRFIHAYAGREVCLSWLSRWWLARTVAIFDFPGVHL